MAKSKLTMQSQPIFKLFCLTYDVDADELEKFVQEHQQKKKSTMTYKAAELITIGEPIRLSDLMDAADPPVTQMEPVDLFYSNIGRSVVKNIGPSPRTITRTITQYGGFGS